MLKIDWTGILSTQQTKLTQQGWPCRPIQLVIQRACTDMSGWSNGNKVLHTDIFVGNGTQFSEWLVRWAATQGLALRVISSYENQTCSESIIEIRLTPSAHLGGGAE